MPRPIASAMLLMLSPVVGAAAFAPVVAHAQVSIGLDLRIGYAPPPLPPPPPQPPLPGPDYLWVPGYWAWSDWIDDYYWVEGYWELPPRPGLYWTPAWWGWDDGAFRFHPGYWGPSVGFYGGINYGHGYYGRGWQGGYWDHGHVFYNRAVNTINDNRVTNVYNRTVIINNQVTNVSYNGGHGGIMAQPAPQERAAMQQPHFAPTPRQMQHVVNAQNNPQAQARAVTPGWQPPAVHRVDNGGRPIPREAVLASHPNVAPPRSAAPSSNTSPAGASPAIAGPATASPATANPASRPSAVSGGTPQHQPGTGRPNYGQFDNGNRGERPGGDFGASQNRGNPAAGGQPRFVPQQQQQAAPRPQTAPVPAPTMHAAPAMAPRPAPQQMQAQPHPAPPQPHPPAQEPRPRREDQH